MSKLTKRTVDAVRPGDRDVFVWDDELPGFGLRVKPSGARSYIVQYRNSHGRTRRMTIGRHGVFTPTDARKEARQILVSVGRGDDPAGERTAARKAPSMGELCDRYLAEHVMLRNKPRTQKQARRIVEQKIKPVLGSLKAEAVMRKDVMDLHGALVNTPREANHVLAILSKILNLAELWDIRPDGSNPCRLVPRFPENVRERFLSEDELGQLGKALNEKERTQTEMPGVIHAVRLLVLTGCRLSEILNLEWEHVDFENSALILPDAKAGARVNIIGAPAQAVLEQIDRSQGSPWVVSGRTPDKPLSINTIQKAWRRTCKAAGLDNVRLHDLRHTVGTYAGQSGANAFLVRDKLGHKTLAMTGRYVSRDAEPLRALSEHVETRIAAALKGEKGAEVILFKPVSRR